jgi:hypothetical protein
MSRNATRASTVFSKTTPKMISKKPNMKGLQKDDMAERRMREMESRVAAEGKKQQDNQAGGASGSVATYAQKAGGSVSFGIPNASTNKAVKAVLKTAEVFKVALKVQQPVNQSFAGNEARSSPPTGPRLAPQGAPTGPRFQPQGDLRGGAVRSTYGSHIQDIIPQQSIQGMHSRPTDSKLSFRLYPLPHFFIKSQAKI